MQQINFYCQWVVINVLVKDIVNVKVIYEVVEGYVVIGVFFVQFVMVEEGVLEVKCWMVEVLFILVGLGVGDLVQYYKVVMIVVYIYLVYVNQIFIGSGFVVGVLVVIGGE